MHRPFANLVVGLLALSLAVPESYARRLGGGRSVGRQAPVYRQRSAPAYQPRQPAPSAPAYVPRQSPDLVQRPAPTPAPVGPNYARQGGSAPWGGMLGGALVGLGLGSLLSSHERNANQNAANAGNGNGNGNGNTDQTPAGQASGTGVNGTQAAGSGDTGQPGQAAPAANEAGRTGFGSILFWGLLALVAFLLFRRSRAKAARRI